MRVIVIGDSIVHGTNDGERLGWVGRLPATEDTQYFNLGVPGQTVGEFLARAHHEVSARIVPWHDTLIIIGATLNDLSLDQDGKMRTDINTLEEQIRTLIKVLQKLAPVLVVGPFPIAEAFNPYHVDALGGEHVWKNVVIGEVDQLYAKICQELEVPYLDMFEALKNDPSYNGSLRDSDGLHPETMGYALVGEYVSNWKALRARLPRE